jgi:dTDP-4-dehydrorhamnose 3,5-epimerase
MKVIETAIPDVKLIVPSVFGDSRGYFMETYKDNVFRDAGITTTFCQDNESCSCKGALRGLHYQETPHSQAKLVRVVRGSVWDVAVDIRKGSPTFGKYVAETLSADNKHQLYIPRGFAHGFLVLEDDTIFCYKCDNYYVPQSDQGIRFDDPMIDILWPNIGVPPILSEKDLKHPLLSKTLPWADVC